MTFVTKLQFRSGDRTTLDDVVGDLKRRLERKGVQCKGPHSDPPERYRIPQYRNLGAGETFEEWTHTVYTRRVEIHGSERIAREASTQEFPPGVRVEVEIEQRRPVGSG
jgi:ribosomal protein S10